MHFQDHAGDVVQNYLMNGGKEESVLEVLNQQYARSLNLHIA
jgi:multiple sugar transport system substrate-binding protein